MSAASEDHHLTEEQRVDWVAGQVAPDSPARIQSHLGECSDCRQRIEAEREISALLRVLPEVEAPRSFALRQAPGRSRWARAGSWAQVGSGIAAGFLVLVLGVDILAPQPLPAPRPDPRARVVESGSPAAESAQAEDSSLQAQRAPRPASDSPRVKALGSQSQGLEDRGTMRLDITLRQLEILAAGIALSLGLLGLFLKRLARGP